ncbi:hypothetical protein AB0D46_34800 [Streptomyces sp. NPDC048383]
MSLVSVDFATVRAHQGPVPSQFQRLLEMRGVLLLFEIRDGTGA